MKTVHNIVSSFRGTRKDVEKNSATVLSPAGIREAWLEKSEFQRLTLKHLKIEDDSSNPNSYTTMYLPDYQHLVTEKTHGKLFKVMIC